MEEKLTTLEKYGYIYHMVGMNPITRKELREKIKKDSPKMSETTLKKYSDAPFDGAYPMFVVKDDKATLDITAFRGFIEELCKYVGTDAAVLFTGPAPAPGGRKGDNPQIAKVPNKAENPQILIERKKNTELSKQIADLEKQIEELRLENQKIVADSVLANMSKEVNISTVRVFGKAVEEDIFLHNVSDVLGEVRDVSKVGGIRQSFYVKDSDKAKELTVQNARSKVAEILFRSKFFEKLFRDSCAYEKKVSGKVDITASQMDANRRKSIDLLLSDDKLSNRAKMPKEKLSWDYLKENGMLDDEMMEYLADRIGAGYGFLISGRGGSGKSTLLNNMVDWIPFNQSILVSQESDELYSNVHPQIQFEHTMTVRKNDVVTDFTLEDELRLGLLQDIDNFIIGEIKGGEALHVFTTAMSTGARFFGTIHSNDARSSVTRLAQCARYVSDYPMETLEEMLTCMPFVLIHMSHFSIDEIVEIDGWDATNKKLKFAQVYRKECK